MRPDSFLMLLALAATPPLLAACSSKLDEGCTSGVCTTSSSGDGGATGSMTSSSTTSGDGSGSVCPPGPATGDVPCDVFEVIHRACHRCHTDPPINAPFPLLTYEDMQQPYGVASKRYQRMNQVIRPDGIPRMPPDGALSAKDFAVLSGWLDACAMPTKEGEGCACTTPTTGKGCTPLP